MMSADYLCVCVFICICQYIIKMNYSFVNINVIKYNEKFLFSSQTLAEKKGGGGGSSLRFEMYYYNSALYKKYISYAFEKINK